VLLLVVLFSTLCFSRDFSKNFGDMIKIRPENDLKRQTAVWDEFWMRVVVEDVAASYSDANCTNLAASFDQYFSVEFPYGINSIYEKSDLIEACREGAKQYLLRVVNMSFPIYDIANGVAGFQFNEKGVLTDGFSLTNGAIFFTFTDEYWLNAAIVFIDNPNQDNYQQLIRARTEATNVLNARSCEAFANKFSSDGRIIDISRTLQGRTNIRNYCNTALSKFQMFRFILSDSWISSDMAVSYGHYVSVNAAGTAFSNTAYTFMQFNDAAQITSWIILGDRPAFV